MPVHEFVDVGPDGHSAMVLDGVPMKLNLGPPKLMAIPRLQDAMELIPRSEWPDETETDELDEALPDHYQGLVGQCELVSEVESVEFLRAMMGLPIVKLSPSFLYALVNRDVDQGASIGDGYDSFRQFGTCRDKLCPTGKFYKRSELTQEMFVDARNYRALLGYHCATFDEIVTARLRGCAVIHPVCVGRTFNDLDADTCYPVAAGMPNHAVSLRNLKRRSNGERYFKSRNHWKMTWGDKGQFGTSESAWDALLYKDALAYEVVTVDANADLPPMPKFTASIPFFVTNPRA